MTESHLRPHAAQGFDGTRSILRLAGGGLERSGIAGGEMTPTSKAPDDRGGDDRAQPAAAVVGVHPYTIEQQDVARPPWVVSEIGGQAGSLGATFDIDPGARGTVGKLADVHARLQGEHQDVRV